MSTRHHDVESTSSQDDLAKESQRRLIDAQLHFNAATSRGLSDAERAIEKDLALAIGKGKTVAGTPHLIPEGGLALSCLPDVNRCPKGWSAQGGVCAAGEGYSGPCSPKAALFQMATIERMAYARICRADFHCQGDCAQNLNERCPSLWSEIAPNLCEAPDNYVGQCARRVDTSGMSDSEKANFGSRCGARWPCESPSPSCERDYSVDCPHGWVKRVGLPDCVAPPTYGRCGRVQRFDLMTPEGKRSWERKCDVMWPCPSQVTLANSAQAFSATQPRHRSASQGAVGEPV